MVFKISQSQFVRHSQHPRRDQEFSLCCRCLAPASATAGSCPTRSFSNPMCAKSDTSHKVMCAQLRTIELLGHIIRALVAGSSGLKNVRCIRVLGPRFWVVRLRAWDLESAMKHRVLPSPKQAPTPHLAPSQCESKAIIPGPFSQVLC